ncbi:MAG: hypothetical protein G01um101418_421 [Parcubacteria group bacterium Gr01-1014_18]|nr:MAG: hypothetical protein Greene041636_333 [Parcubacteria group bacterium Greene0416_36]TSC81142.1 MAG: hypothetical protein G01um101418_421 [Parcubacteria group bacterium Gr01-1014_18]TSC98441.1 MAG: hypothetical protein Greene101420_678 [Parcubacteria group bacterium Greene1014_20]TSD07393.1 MAG: hypothetical protein Greene07142_248 [Parcubacteria group bacterium Greene0714_2]
MSLSQDEQMKIVSRDIKNRLDTIAKEIGSGEVTVKILSSELSRDREFRFVKVKFSVD